MLERAEDGKLWQSSAKNRKEPTDDGIWTDVAISAITISKTVGIAGSGDRVEAFLHAASYGPYYQKTPSKLRHLDMGRGAFPFGRLFPRIIRRVYKSLQRFYVALSGSPRKKPTSPSFVRLHLGDRA
jgi:hypothetical protein